MAKAKKKETTRVENNIDMDMKADDFITAYLTPADVLTNPEFNKTFSTGIIPIDMLLIGGLMEGNNAMFYGSPGCGKSTIAIQIAKMINDLYGKRTLIIDTEKGLRNQIGAFGLTPYIQSGAIGIFDRDPTFEVVEKMLDSVIASKEHVYDMIIVDSVADLIPRAILERSVEDQLVAAQAKIMTTFLTKYRHLLSSKGIITIFINQERANLKAANPYSPPTIIAGCVALQYKQDITLKFNKGTAIKGFANTPNGREEIELGRLITVEAQKNRKGNPFIKLSMPFYYGEGILNAPYLAILLKNKKLIKQAGAYWKTNLIPNPKGEEWTLQGMSGVSNWIDENFDEINEVLYNMGAYNLVGATEQATDELEI
jgi:recombination protein RecA